jgi:prepilin-type processing-associated H-X9-DG protein
MNFSIPLYDVNGNDMPQNTTVYINSATTFATIQDGTSNTALMSESIIGNNSNIPPPPNAPNPQEVEVQLASGITDFASTFTYNPLDPVACANANCFRWDRQTNWIEGDYRHTLCDHYYPPNSPSYDCLRGPVHGWRTARSKHPGGVNALCADGSVRFVKNSINDVTWRALGTCAGGEIISSDSY